MFNNKPNLHMVEQNSPEWLQLRMGIITASEMSSVMSKGRGGNAVGRNTYMNKLLGERICPEHFRSNYHDENMERGHMHELYAVRMYQEYTGNMVKRNGFYTNFEEAGTVGYSPDGRVDNDPEGSGLIEIKSRAIHLQIDIVIEQTPIPADHYAQMQCGLWVSDREWCDYISVCEYLGAYIKRVRRDDAFIAGMQKAVDDFYTDMLVKMKKLVEFQKTAPMMRFTEDDGYEGDIIDEFVKGNGKINNVLGA